MAQCILGGQNGVTSSSKVYVYKDGTKNPDFTFEQEKGTVTENASSITVNSNSSLKVTGDFVGKNAHLVYSRSDDDVSVWFQAMSSSGTIDAMNDKNMIASGDRKREMAMYTLQSNTVYLKINEDDARGAFDIHEIWIE